MADTHPSPNMKNMQLHSPEDHCRLKMALTFGHEVPKALEKDWLLTFQRHMCEAKPVLWCKVYAFDYTMPLHLEAALGDMTNLNVQLPPLLVHQVVFKVSVCPCYNMHTSTVYSYRLSVTVTSTMNIGSL